MMNKYSDSSNKINVSFFAHNTIKVATVVTNSNDLSNDGVQFSNLRVMGMLRIYFEI